tara:strand:+ start:29 stop:406 length:378 start_codon:yes stop_codon:yes gene_type:complete
MASIPSKLLGYFGSWNQSIKVTQLVGGDSKCYPPRISPTENYWYLTESGWAPCSQMDFTKMRAELNIYKVVHSHFSSFLGEGSYVGSARPIWTADLGSYEFEAEAERLEKKFGDMPENKRMFSMP